MNHRKFIQLLNLYIDGEASAAETREVEHEIETNPARRRIYDDYCRIQVATRAMYAQFRSGHEVTSPSQLPADRTAATGNRLAAIPGRTAGRPFRPVLFWSGGAVAACMAIAVAFWSLPHGAQPPRTAIESSESPGLRVEVPADASAIAAAPAREVPSGTIAAPFAVQTPADPFLLRTNMQLGDPFSLSPASRQRIFAESTLVLAPAGGVDADGFSPAASPLDPERIAEQNRKLQAILRASVGGPVQAQPGTPAPVNLLYQP